MKGPSEQHFKNEIDKALGLGKFVVLAGCVPQADKGGYYKPYSTIGVQQVDQVVHVVEETLKGNKVSFMGNKRGRLEETSKIKKLGGAVLNLPKMRRNKVIEIIPVSTGCLNSCTYCKTKLARGDLASYTKGKEISQNRHEKLHVIAYNVSTFTSITVLDALHFKFGIKDSIQLF